MPALWILDCTLPKVVMGCCWRNIAISLTTLPRQDHRLWEPGLRFPQEYFALPGGPPAIDENSFTRDKGRCARRKEYERIKRVATPKAA